MLVLYSRAKTNCNFSIHMYVSDYESIRARLSHLQYDLVLDLVILLFACSRNR